MGVVHAVNTSFALKNKERSHRLIEINLNRVECGNSVFEIDLILPISPF
jgi:hypothetical protein